MFVLPEGQRRQDPNRHHDLCENFPVLKKPNVCGRELVLRDLIFSTRLNLERVDGLGNHPEDDQPVQVPTDDAKQPTSQPQTELGFCATHRREPGGRHRRKSLAGTAAHQSVLTSFHLSLSQDWWYAFFFSLGRDWSCPVATVLWSSLSTHSFFSSTHHDVLECQPITKFLRCCYCFQKKASFFNLYFDLLLTCVM